MKKIDISEVTPFDQLYITKSSKVEGKEEVNVPKYVIESEMISYEGNILEEINKRIRLYIKVSQSYSQIDFFYDNYEGTKKCDYEDIRVKMKANKYMEYLLSASVIVKLDPVQSQVTGTMGSSALDVICDMYDVYGQDEYYEFLDDFMSYVKRNNMSTRSRK